MWSRRGIIAAILQLALAMRAKTHYRSAGWKVSNGNWLATRRIIIRNTEVEGTSIGTLLLRSIAMRSTATGPMKPQL